MEDSGRGLWPLFIMAVILLFWTWPLFLVRRRRAKRTFWYLSFADDDGFLGAVVVEATGFMDAVMKTRTLKINPGGEVMGHPFCPEETGCPLPMDTLLSTEDLGEDAMTIEEIELEQGKSVECKVVGQ